MRQTLKRKQPTTPGEGSRGFNRLNFFKNSKSVTVFKPLGDSLSVSHIFLWIIKTKRVGIIEKRIAVGNRERERKRNVQTKEFEKIRTRRIEARTNEFSGSGF